MDKLTKDDINTFINQNKIMMKNLSNALIRHLIIYLLKDNELHGYAIMKKIDEFFKPEIDKNIIKNIPSSKIYPILNKMENEGLIKSKESENNNMKIKLYTTTKKGEKVYELINKEINENLKRKIWKDFLKEIIL